jgi:hypothetical protein
MSEEGGVTPSEAPSRRPGARRAKGLLVLGGPGVHSRGPDVDPDVLRRCHLDAEHGKPRTLGAYASQRLSAHHRGKADLRQGRRAETRTGLGKSDRPGSQGGLRKHGPRWNCDPTPLPKGREWKPSAYSRVRRRSIPTPGNGRPGRVAIEGGGGGNEAVGAWEKGGGVRPSATRQAVT